MGRNIEFCLARWLSFARKFRGFVICAWAALAVLFGAFAVNQLGINTDTSDMIDPDAPYRIDQAAFETVFPKFGDQILILVRADTPDAADAFGQALGQELRLQTDYIRSVYSPALDPFFQENGLLFLDISELEGRVEKLSQAAPLIERLTLNPSLPSLFDALGQAAGDTPNGDADALFVATAQTLEANLEGVRKPLSWRLAFYPDAKRPYQRLLTIDPVLDTTRLRPSSAVEDAIARAAQTVMARTEITADISVTGNPVLRSDELKSVSNGIGLAFFISFLLVGILLVWALRSVVLAAFTLASLVISISITAGIAALLFTQLNLISIAFTVLMVGLGVDFAIHLLLHIVHERRQGKSVSAAYFRTARGIGLALVLTAPSTALAFLAFVPTRFAGMSQLGVIAAIGVVTAFLVATSFLPAVYAYLPAPKPQRKDTNALPVSATSSETRFGPKVAVGIIILSALAVFVLPSARFDADPMALRSTKAPSVIAFNQLFDTPETVPYRLSYLAADAQDANKMAETFEALNSVKSARSLSSFVPKDQIDKLDLLSYAVIGLEFAVSGEGGSEPSAPDAAGRLIIALENGQKTESSQRLLTALQAWKLSVTNDNELMAFTERDLLFYWPYELAQLRAQIKASEITLKSIPANITSRYVAPDGTYRVEIVPAEDVRDEVLRRAFIDDVLSVAPNASGSARSVQEAGQIIQRAMLQAILAALIMVSILLYWVVREIRLVIIMLIPLVLAGVLTTASATLLGLSYNFANVIVLPLLIGIGVDSSLHLALKSYKSAHLQSRHETITPRAVLFSGFTTIASFGSLTFSPHRGTSSMGALLTIAIVWVIICTVMLTPSLIAWFGPKKNLQIIPKS